MAKLYSNPYIRGFVLSLEVTAKPFKSRDPKEVEKVCRELFRIWKRPVMRADEVCICMSIGNGEHILKWSGNMDDLVIWDQWKGHNNARYAFDMDSFAGIPLENYIDNPLPMKYSDLYTIGETLKRVCKEECSKNCRLFTNFEPGPEFAESAFKYVEHPEILNKQGAAHGASVAFDACLHKDAYHYAAYPDGIPEGEPFSRFLGKQVNHFFKTFGYEGKIMPHFEVTDKNAEKLGFYQNCACGLAYKNETFYCGAGRIPFDVFTDAARRAGVHLYYENGAAVYASTGFIAVSTTHEENVAVTLPYDCSLVEMFENKEYKTENKLLRYTAPKGTTKLFKIV